MGLPLEVLAGVATLDGVATVASVLHLGVFYIPQAVTNSSILQSTTVGSKVSSFFHRLSGNAAFASSSQAITVKVDKQNAPRKLLFVLLVTCFARCGFILMTYFNLSKAIVQRRAGAAAQDWSGTAMAFSIVCVISMLLNLSALNTLFQSHYDLSRDNIANIDTSVVGILKQLNASSLAAEQLLLSGLEWILFVICIGTNKELARPPTSEERNERANRSALPASQGTSAPNQAPSGPSNIPPSKSYGALSEPRHVSDTNMTESQGMVASSTQGIGVDGGEEGNKDHNGVHMPSEASTVTDTVQGDANASDIVDIPSDRSQGKQAAKDRLQRARENGKVRRRSLWKKIRGKASSGNSTEEGS